MLKKIIFISLFCAAAFILFFFLSSQIPLWSSDEGRFADIARGMLSSRDWIVPHFNGLPYLEKPPLASWLTALSFKTFGMTPLAARLPGILAALGGLLITFFFTKKLFNTSVAFFSTLCLLTSAGYVLVGRFAVIDMEMIFLLSCALFFAALGFFQQKNGHYIASAVFMGLTFLAKGLIGAVLPAAIFFIFLLSIKRLDELKKIHIWILMILLFLVIVTPWVYTITKYQPEFLDIFIFEHHFKRFATSTFGRKRPFLFFTYILPIIAFPWSIFMPASIAAALKNSRQNKDRLLFFIIWAVVIFIFFSIPRSKLPYYIVPVTVPLAVLVGSFLSQWINRENMGNSEAWAAWSWKVLGVICLLGAVSLPISLFFSGEVPELEILRPVLPWASLILAAGGIGTLYFLKKDQRKLTLTALVGAVFFLFIMIFLCMFRLSPMQSTAIFAASLQKNAEPEDIIAIYGSPDRYSDLPFYLSRPVAIIGTDRGTLTRESFQEENQSAVTDWVFVDEDFAKQMMAEKSKRIFCLLDQEHLQTLQKKGLTQYHVWLESHGRTLISNY